MVEFETKETREVKFGNNKFLEVARKVAKTPEGENEFISISKGFKGAESSTCSNSPRSKAP